MDRDIELNSLVKIRQMLTAKGYCDTSDVMAFVPCTRYKARKIIKAIRSQVKTEGIENLNNSYVRTSRLIDFLGLGEQDV